MFDEPNPKKRHNALKYNRLNKSHKRLKFTPNDVVILTCTPPWAVEEVLNHPDWQKGVSQQNDMGRRYLTLELGFQLGILGQLLAFGLTYDQAQQAFAIAEKGFTNPDVLLPENNAQSYKGREWLPDFHLLIDNWSLCAVAHAYQLRETDNLAWYDINTGQQTTKVYHPAISTARIPISDLYNWLLHVLPTEPTSSPDG